MGKQSPGGCCPKRPKIVPSANEVRSTEALALPGGCCVKSSAKTGAAATEMHLGAAVRSQAGLHCQRAINESRRSGTGAQNSFSEAAGGLCDSLVAMRKC
jgi:hypothetical protein